MEEIEKLDDEIAQLERKLGVKGDKRKKDKIQKQIEQEGLGVGFMSFLDEIDSLVKDTSKKYKKKDYAFLDDAQEVAIAEEDFLKGGQSDDQSGFSGDMEMDEGREESEEEEDGEDEMSDQSKD